MFLFSALPLALLPARARCHLSRHECPAAVHGIHPLQLRLLDSEPQRDSRKGISSLNDVSTIRRNLFLAGNATRPTERGNGRACEHKNHGPSTALGVRIWHEGEWSCTLGCSKRLYTTGYVVEGRWDDGCGLWFIATYHAWQLYVEAKRVDTLIEIKMRGTGRSDRDGSRHYYIPRSRRRLGEGSQQNRKKVVSFHGAARKISAPIVVHAARSIARTCAIGCGIGKRARACTQEESRLSPK